MPRFNPTSCLVNMNRPLKPPRPLKRSSHAQATNATWPIFKSTSAISTTARTASKKRLASYQRAYEKLLTLRDSEGLAVALYNISVCLIALNDFNRALDTYRRAREMCAQDGMTLLVGQADYNIAYLYYLRGEYAHAIDMLRAAREISEKNGDEHILALCHLDLSDIYLELNLTAEASETAHEGFQRFAKLGMGYEEAKCIANEALAHGRQGHAPRALELFEQARAAFHRENNATWCSLIDLYQALVLYNEGRLEESRRLCQQAFEFFGPSTLEGKAASCCLLLARIDLKEKNPEACRTRCHEALRRLSKLELPALNFHANLLMGQAVRALGHRRTGTFILRNSLPRLGSSAVRLAQRRIQSRIHG